MTVEKVIENVAAMPNQDWLKIQAGLADMIATRCSERDLSEIRSALSEADSEFQNGEGLTSTQMRAKLGIA
jgi:hypothetical protein